MVRRARKGVEFYGRLVGSLLLLGPGAWIVATQRAYFKLGGHDHPMSAHHGILVDAAGAGQANETRIRALVEEWARAVRAKDMDRVLAHHTDEIVMFDVPVPLQSRGMEEYRKTWELFFDHSPGGPGSFDVTELRIIASETVAYCHALVNIADSTVRVTMGLRKEKGDGSSGTSTIRTPLSSIPGNSGT